MKTCISAVVVLFVAAAVGQGDRQPTQQTAEKFQEGCCVNPSFPRPTEVSAATIPDQQLFTALNCTTNNRFIGGTANVAKSLRSGDALRVAYYYGKFMPEQGGSALTVAVYSPDGKHGILFDVVWEKDRYLVQNLPPLLRAGSKWRVGEVNGGLWTYTRLWYLAQEIGSRPRQRIAVAAIDKHRPAHCGVFVEDQTNWKPDANKYVGESVRQATPKP